MVLAFDIESTKITWKLPTAISDQIIMISSMIDTQRSLIINREIDAFEYTTKKEYLGHFHLFNEHKEFELFKRFFNQIVEVKPHLLVTYNGHSFDMPFVEQRAQSSPWKIFNQIAFLNSLSRPSIHMDWIKSVNRHS